MTDHQHEPDGPVTPRRQPASLSTGPGFRASGAAPRFTAAKERLMPAAEPEQHWTIALRCQPAGPGTSKPENPSSRTYEIICRICGDDPALDHQQMSAELQQIRGPYTLSDGIAAFARHNESHNGTGEMQR